MVIARPRSSSSSLLLLAASLITVYGVCALMTSSLLRVPSRELVATAVSFDLTITASALTWWLGVRRGALPRWAPWAVLSLGLSLSTRLPHAPHSLGRVLAAAGIALEALVITSLALRLPKVVRAVRRERLAGPIGALEAGLREARLPAQLAAITAGELAVFFLVLTGWVRKPDKADRSLYSMRRSGWLGIAGVFAFLIAVESLAVHVALAQWSPLVAWIATASSMYALAWLVADCHAIRLYPVAVAEGALWLRLGLRWRARVPLELISSVETISEVPEGAAKLSLLEPTVLVTTTEPIELVGLLGVRRRADRIALTIDEPERFLAALRGS